MKMILARNREGGLPGKLYLIREDGVSLLCNTKSFLKDEISYGQYKIENIFDEILGKIIPKIRGKNESFLQTAIVETPVETSQVNTDMLTSDITLEASNVESLDSVEKMEIVNTVLAGIPYVPLEVI